MNITIIEQGSSDDAKRILDKILDTLSADKNSGPNWYGDITISICCTGRTSQKEV